MSAPPQPGKEHVRYDRWTFDKWAVRRAQPRRPLRRWGAWVLLCFGLTLLCAALGRGAWDRHAHRLAASRAAALRSGPGALAGVVVILDPGHGGEDSGASLRWGRQRVQEAALTYRTALEVANVLRAQGAQVHYTVRSRMLRDGWERVEPTPTQPVDAVLVSTDRPLRRRARRSPRQLWQRADAARRVWDDVRRTDPRAAQDVFFLSLHFDEFHDPEVRGGLVCVDRRAGPPPAFGLALAQSLTAHGWGRPEVADGQAGLASDELGVLNPRYNPVPEKALLELATLSNLDDYLSATDPAWRGRVALAVAQAIGTVHQAPTRGVGGVE